MILLGGLQFKDLNPCNPPMPPWPLRLLLLFSHFQKKPTPKSASLCLGCRRGTDPHGRTHRRPARSPSHASICTLYLYNKLTSSLHLFLLQDRACKTLSLECRRTLNICIYFLTNTQPPDFQFVITLKTNSN